MYIQITEVKRLPSRSLEKGTLPPGSRWKQKTAKRITSLSPENWCCLPDHNKGSCLPGQQREEPGRTFKNSEEANFQIANRKKQSPRSNKEHGADLGLQIKTKKKLCRSPNKGSAQTVIREEDFPKEAKPVYCRKFDRVSCSQQLFSAFREEASNKTKSRWEWWTRRTTTTTTSVSTLPWQATSSDPRESEI